MVFNFSFGGETQSKIKGLRTDLWGGMWRVKVKEKLGLLGPGPGWKLSGDGVAGLLCPVAGAGHAAGAWPCQG